MNRRHFLKSASAVTIGFMGLHKLLGCASKTPAHYGFGPLLPDPEKILDLPKGFSYRIISRPGQKMTDGFFVPELPDGMATFPGPNDLTIIVRNHEINFKALDRQGAFGKDNQLLEKLPKEMIYDLGANGYPCLGGTTTLVYDTKKQQLEREFLSLAGTLRNCAGGPTPWNSWITCEETTAKIGDYCSRDHGYTFEVPATAEPALSKPVPLKAMGRFNHEAVAAHPATSIVYQTEDAYDGLIYRFIPDQPGRLAGGGKLQALCVIDQPGLDTRNWDGRNVSPNETLAVRWCDLENIDAPEDDLRKRGFADGCACFARGEGMWFGNDAVYFACTNGGKKKKGQIWKYTPSPLEGLPEEESQPGMLELFIEPNNGELVENADNLTVAPWGDLIVCEDGAEENFIFGVTPAGGIYRFGKNAMSYSEFAGATFSPDGSTLFVNIQKEGLTLAISGPWQNRKTEAS